MTTITTNYMHLCMLLEDIMIIYRIETTAILHQYMSAGSTRQRLRVLDRAWWHNVLRKIPLQMKNLDRLVHWTNVACVANLRMDRNTFARLCRILSGRGGLKIGKCPGIEEQIAIFLSILAHHKKNRVVSKNFWRSGGTVSRCVHNVLAVVLSLHSILLSKPTPVPDDCTDHRWRWFKGCLGAPDGTYINVLVSNGDKRMYRTRKGANSNKHACCL
ncbi:uncharacterized protein LOC121764627 [Salvia splendens]|uniref:uncharacterized protein LOC121764627 n=1 Tax=Salvia splendens TaxID=180675 RepID=UPI001C2713E1|nr:uncharacterized protein LOC121764627 [Salvia splendens]